MNARELSNLLEKYNIGHVLLEKTYPENDEIYAYVINTNRTYSNKITINDSTSGFETETEICLESLFSLTDLKKYPLENWRILYLKSLKKLMKCIGEMKEQIKQIHKGFEDYIINNNLKSAIIGISGGLDSAVNAALLYPVCQKLQIPLIGRYIHIDSNKYIEKETAIAIGNAFCSDFKCIDLTMAWRTFPTENPDSKIRSGNIKARMRMMYLRDLAHIHSGIMIDNSNFTEWNLGFFTIADGGDYSPLFYYWKTEVYQIARELLNECNEEQQIALQKAINMVPTDGLGISSSDLEQIGAESYEQVDSILQEILAWKWFSLEKRGDTYESIKDMRDAFLEEQAMYCYPIDVIINVTDRHFNSEFKRKQLPIKITRDEI